MRTTTTRASPAVRFAAVLAAIAVLANFTNAKLPSTKFPSPDGTVAVSKTMVLSGSYDGGMKRYVPEGLGNGGDGENQDALFRLEPGATLSNVIIGAPGADGIHCFGTCTLENVWWEDVGEDAATLASGSEEGSVFTVDGGGAKGAADKVFQNNGPGGSMIIRNFYADGFAKFYSSGVLESKRSVRVENVLLSGGQTAVVDIREEWGDTAILRGITIEGSEGMKICIRKQGGDRAEGPGGGCDYSPSDITHQ